MMHMTFYWSRDVTLLVQSWRTQSWTAYALALLACFVSAALFQCLEACRIGLKLRIHKHVQHSLSSLRSSPATVDDGSSSPLLRKIVSGSKWVSFLSRVAEGVFFGVSAAVGYLLMLAVMSFNSGVFVSIVCGLAAGYAAFRGGIDDADEANAAAMVSDENDACACA